MFLKPNYRLDEAGESGGGGIETPSGSESTVIDVVNKIGKSVEAIRSRSEKDLDRFGKITEETKQIATEVAEEVGGLTKRMNQLETDNNRVDLGDARSLDVQNKKAITAEVLAKASPDFLSEVVGTEKALEDDYAAVTIPPFFRKFDELNQDQQKVAVAHGQVFWKYVRRGGEKALTRDEQAFMLNLKASVISDDTNAGYLLAPNVLVSNILGNVREFSPVRSVADVRSGTSLAIEQPRRTADISGAWVGETGTRSETTGLTHGMETITAHEHYVQLHASRQMLADSAYDLDSYFGELAGEAFGVLEGTAFISGSGAGQPTGILTDTAIGNYPSLTAATIASDDIAQIPFNIKAAYRSDAAWMMNRVNIGRVMILQDGAGAYHWRQSLEPGQPSTLAGYPVLEATDLASTEATTDVVALFGSFRRGYRVYDRMGMEVLRDPYSSKNTGLVEFDFYRRVGGKVILPEAIIEYELS